MLLFENSIKSEATKKSYIYHLKKFVEFNNIEDYDSLARIDREKLQIIVEDYVMHLKKVISPNSIALPLSAIKTLYPFIGKIRLIKTE